MPNNRQDNIDILDALRYSVNMSLNRLRQTLRVFSMSFDETTKVFERFKIIFGSEFTPYHKTKAFRREMYYRRYYRRGAKKHK